MVDKIRIVFLTFHQTHPKKYLQIKYGVLLVAPAASFIKTIIFHTKFARGATNMTPEIVFPFFLESDEGHKHYLKFCPPSEFFNPYFRSTSIKNVAPS
jgi:hypothetical protein